MAGMMHFIPTCPRNMITPVAATCIICHKAIRQTVTFLSSYDIKTIHVCPWYVICGIGVLCQHLKNTVLYQLVTSIVKVGGGTMGKRD